MIAASAWGQVWEVGEQGLISTDPPQAFAQFGQVLTTGDFNGDGYRDLVAAAPLLDVGVANGGALQLHWGGPLGLATGAVSWSGAQAEMNLGAALAAGDFNHDGDDEIAVGAPGWNVAAVSAAGRFYVFDYDGAGWVISPWNQGDLSLTSETDDRFGEVLAVGDFNDDTFEDLAVGMPSEDLSLANSGAIVVIYGSAAGLTAVDSIFVSQTAIAPPEQANAGIGRELAAGDFNGDDLYYDLAIGAPGFDVSGSADAGLVAVLYGGAAGLSTTGLQLFDDGILGGSVVAGDNFGAAVATGDFTRTAACWAGFTCRTDLAIGVPGKTVGGAANAGRAWVLYGGGGILQFNQGNLSGSSPETGDRFGEVLLSEWYFAAGLNGPSVGFPGADDLVIGVPSENWNGVSFQGVVHLVFGSAAGLNAGDPSQWRIAADGLSSAPPAAFDNFGYSLALGGFNPGTYADLAIGVVGRDTGATQNTGMVQVMYGALFADGFESGGAGNWSSFLPLAEWESLSLPEEIGSEP